MLDSLQEQDREELVSFLKERSILCVLDDTIIHGLSLSLEEVHCGPGFVVFHEDDESDGLYIIKQGSVEVRKNGSDTAPIAYLTAGECFGEMSIVHGGLRTASIRVPEEAVILKLSKKASTDLTAKFPLLAQELNKLAQKRAAGKIRFEAPGLQGNTAFFDLPTVIQAVNASRQSGYLKVSATAHTPEAKVSFNNGTIVSAEFKHLTGEAAVFELLCRQDPADFVFERVAEMILPAGTKSFRQIERILIDGARRSDEQIKLTDTVGGLGMTFSIVDDTPKWDALPAGSRDFARILMKFIEADLSIEEMLPMVEVDRFTVLRTLSEMLDKGLLKQLVKLHTSEALAIDLKKKDPRRTTTTLDILNLRKQPVKLASTLYALNMVASNLATLMNADIVKSCLEEALNDSAKVYPQLVGLKVHPAGKTIDVRGASPELTKRGDSRKALSHLTVRFLQLVAENQAV